MGTYPVVVFRGLTEADPRIIHCCLITFEGNGTSYEYLCSHDGVGRSAFQLLLEPFTAFSSSG
jgi:hypothetical protein